MLETSRLYLKFLDQEDENSIVIWRNRKEIIQNLFSYKGVTIDEHRNWYQNYLKNNTRIEFVLVKKEDRKKIGTIGLSDIDFKNQKAEYGILIGEKCEQGKGYAKEATIEIIRYGFEELNLQKIYLKVFINNQVAIKMYDNLGFVKEGTLRREVFKNGKFNDVLIMSILIDEWKNNYAKHCYKS